ncbi:chemokine vCXCL1 [Panine betaherpesvirus 2]|uniref:Chemokine vCXCL1 n=1 Tax=Panine betaherpesvirus 2 TaxID=188763 RepID=Q8QRX6_9BETA|nr:chemokine vCXCL1 [Panine betaherpesvirus 2]AAM00768.1 chemokine vCXCL1 [Panine betaherpesvirus 2]QXV67875.1 chemokine vCXCL1 [Panine betaherpesvirus 2]
MRATWGFMIGLLATWICVNIATEMRCYCSGKNMSPEHWFPRKRHQWVECISSSYRCPNMELIVHLPPNYNQKVCLGRHHEISKQFLTECEQGYRWFSVIVNATQKTPLILSKHTDKPTNFNQPNGYQLPVRT